jgi:uncharacterized protein (TIGR03437 family)
MSLTKRMLARIRLRNTVLAVCCFATFVSYLSGAQPPVLNMSHDLVTYGIASSNLAPDTPSEDARALFEAAAAYATKNNITTLTADPGSYYFLSLHAGTTAHAYLNAAANVTVDWQGSDLYFANSNYAAITCANCNAVTMQNFTVDYQQLPFTQVTITAVNSATGALTYADIPGFQDPSAFNTNRAADGSDAIWIFIFRNGAPLGTVGRLSGSRPVSGNILTIADITSPWSEPAALATIQPGDIAVFTDRSGPPALNFVQGQNITVHNVSVFSSGQIALYFGRTLAPTADHVQVMPRPGTTRLISSNADGIHISFANGASTYTNNIVERTCDDELAIAEEWIGTVSSTSASGTVTVTRSIVGVPFPEGTSVSFVNPANDTVIGSAGIVSESPPFSAQTLAAGETVVLTLSAPVAGVANGYQMIYANPSQHGGGSVISGNVARQGVFSRGIWLSGVDNVSVHDNLITQTSKPGIFIEQLAAPPGSGNLLDTAPSSGVTIQNNMVDNSINYGGISEGPLLDAGSVQVMSVGGGGGQVTSSPNSNIAIQNNLISNAPRSGIRVENTSSGQISGNSIQGYGASATADVYYAPSCCETVAQYKTDFAQAIVVMTSAGVTNASNPAATGSGALISSVSVASYFPKGAPGSLVAGFWTNPAIAAPASSSAPFPISLGGVSVSVIDSAGASRPAPIYYVSSSLFFFVVPDGTASGLATISSGTFSGALLIDTVAPGIYSQNSSGEGVAAGTWALVSSSGTSLSVGYTANVPCALGACVAAPIDLGEPGDQLIVSLYGTGIQNAGGLSNVHATIGGIAAQVTYAGAQGYQALDQVNIIVPAALAGAGEVPIVLTIDGQTANTVTMSLK